MRLITAFLFLFIVTSSYGQESPENVSIYGSVYDAETNAPLQYATVTLQNIKTKNFTGGITNKKGRFEFSIPPGKYKFSVEFISFNPFVIKELDINQDIDFGMIALSQSSEKLNEVEVSAGKSVMSYKYDKKIYYSSKDIGNSGGSAITVLENTPTVRVDEEGGINIRGNKAMILVNGKPFGGEDATGDVLSLIPSNTINRIEIYSPSAKYDANSGGGIVNIILKKGKGLGFKGTMEVHGGLPGNDGVSSFINYKSDKINVYSTVSFNHTIKIKNADMEQEYFNTHNNPAGNMEQNRKDDRQKNSFLFNIGSDFAIDDKNTVSTSILYSTSNKNYDSDIFFEDFNNSGSLIQTTNRDISDNTDDNNLEALINYTTVFDDDDHKLSFNLKYNGLNSENNADILNTVAPNDVSKQNSNKDQKLSTYLFQGDYQIPFEKNRLLETGFKTKVRKFSNNFLYSILNPDTQNFESVEGFANDILYDEYILAAYLKYSKYYEDLNFSLAVRSEKTYTQIQELNIDSNDKNDYLDFFPSLNIGYTLKDEGILTFNYSRFIERPEIAQLNPFTSIADNRFILSGNPYLKPSYTNYFILEYYKEIKKISLTTALFYSGSTDYIRYIIENSGEQNSDNFDIYLRRPVNDGNLDQYGFDVSLTYIAGKHLRLRGYVSPYYYVIRNTFENIYDNEDYVIYANLVGDYRFSNGLKFQLNYTYQSPKKTAVTTLKAIQFLNATVSMDLLKKKATLTFRANDILQTRTYDYESFEANTFTHKNWRFDSQFLISFMYRFNKASKRNSHNRSKDIDKEVFELDEDIK